MIITVEMISTEHVTPEQIGNCTKCFDGSTPFYMVLSETQDLVEYKVRWNGKARGFSCTCPAGQNGFARCRQGVCKHCVWAVAAAREEKAAVAELHKLIAEQAAPVSTAPTIDTATLARIEAANERQAGKVSKAAPYQVKGFSLLR
jgi:hypothetical protein